MTHVCMVAYTQYTTDTRVRREAEALAARGDEVKVISLREDGRPGSWELNGVRVYALPLGRYRGSNAGLYLVEYLKFFFTASWLLTSAHLKKRYHVVQVHTMPDFMVFVAVLPRLLGAKVVLDVHDLMPELYQSKFGLPKTHWLIRFVVWVERISIRFADTAIAVHQPHLDLLVSRGNPKGKLAVLLNVPDPKIFTKRAAAVSTNGRGLKMIYHGTLARRHGLDIALRAMALLRGRLAGLQLHIIGDGDDLPRLMELIRSLQLTDCVTLSGGMRPMEELVPKILDADIGIVPILYDEFTRWMLPVKLLEYVGLGKPVICTRTETIEAYFDSSMVQYSKPASVSDFADQVAFLYQHPERREELRINSDRFNQEHDWDRQKQSYYDLIDDLLGRSILQSSKLAEVPFLDAPASPHR